MKSLKMLLTWAFACLIGSANAQYYRDYFEVEKGEEIRTRLGFRPLAADAGQDSSYFVVSYPGVGVKPLLLKFDKNLKNVGEQEVDLWFNRKMQDFEGIEYFGDSLQLFSSSSDLWITKNRLFVQTVDPKTLLASQPQIVVESENLAGNFSEFIISVSDDRSKLMICSYAIAPRKESIRLQVSVFDRGMKKIWSGEKLFTDLDRFSFLIQSVVDNNGDAFFLISTYKERLWKLNAELKNQVGLASFTQKGSNIRLHRIDIPYLFLRDTRIVPTHTGKVNCLGLYSSSFTDEFAKGTYFITYNPETDEREISKYSPFEFFLLEKLQSEKEIQKGRELFNFYLDTLFIRNDKSVIAIFEQKYIEQLQVRQTNTRGDNPLNRLQNEETVKYRKKYNDIIVMRFTPEGDIDWSHSLKKKQEYEDGNYIDFCSLSAYAPQNSDEIFLFYNVHRRSPKRKPNPDAKPKTFMYYPRLYSSLKMFTVSDVGLSEERILFDTDKKKTIPIPSATINPMNNEFLFLGMHYHKFNLIRLNYEPDNIK